MLDLLTVGPNLRGPRVICSRRCASPPLHGFAAAARAAPGTDRRTDGHRAVLIRFHTWQKATRLALQLHGNARLPKEDNLSRAAFVFVNVIWNILQCFHFFISPQQGSGVLRSVR